MFFYDQSGYARSYAPVYGAIRTQRPVPVNIDGPCPPEADVTRSFIKENVPIVIPADVDLNPSGAVYEEVYRRAAARLGTTFPAIQDFVRGTMSAAQARGYTADEAASYANFCTAELARGVPLQRLPSAKSVIERARNALAVPRRAGTSQAFGGRSYRSARFTQAETKAVIPEDVTVMKPNGFDDADVRSAVTKKIFAIGAANVNTTVQQLGQWVTNTGRETIGQGYSAGEAEGYVNYCLTEIVHGKTAGFRPPGEVIAKQRQIAAEYAQQNRR